jgi:dolichol kinase
MQKNPHISSLSDSALGESVARVRSGTAHSTLPPQSDISYRQEIYRKLIHLCSLSIPIIYAFITRELALALLAALFFPTFAIDLARRWIPSLNAVVKRVFGDMMRVHELDEGRILLNGATYVLLSALLCVLLFPKIIAITAFAVLIVSDIASALIGRKFGKRKFFDKSLEGALAFWVSAWCVVAVIWSVTGAPWQYAALAAVATFIGGVVEAASIRLKMDDNFSIPLSVGTTLWGMIFALDAHTQRAILSLFHAPL